VGWTGETPPTEPRAEVIQFNSVNDIPFRVAFRKKNRSLFDKKMMHGRPPPPPPPRENLDVGHLEGPPEAAGDDERLAGHVHPAQVVPGPREAGRTPLPPSLSPSGRSSIVPPPILDRTTASGRARGCRCPGAHLGSGSV